MQIMNEDEDFMYKDFMYKCIKLAQKAGQQGDFPIGSLVAWNI